MCIGALSTSVQTLGFHTDLIHISGRKFIVVPPYAIIHIFNYVQKNIALTLTI